jgi:hypothetical protein
MVLSVLGVVFLMHGVQCVGEDHGGEHAVLALGAHPSGGMADSMGATALASQVDALGVGTVLSAGVAPGERIGSGLIPPSPLSHGGPCLVLLTVGLTLLLAVSRRRRRTDPLHGPGPPVERGDAAAAVARPLSLAQLCLLRL